jgi:hypothetical protein
MSTNAERQGEYRDHMHQRGYRRIVIWIPARDTERVKAYIKRLVATFERGA